MAASRNLVTGIMIITIIGILAILGIQYHLLNQPEKPNTMTIITLTSGEILLTAIMTFMLLILS